MSYITSSVHFSAIVSALKEPPPRGEIGSSVASRMVRVAAERWAHRYFVEDLLLDMDRRLDSHGAGDVDALMAMFGYNYTSFAHRPKKNVTDVMLSQGLAAANFAELLMNLESIGFRVDPAPLSNVLCQQLASEKNLSSSELSVLWFESTRHRGMPVQLKSHEITELQPGKSEEWTTATGYRVQVIYSGEDVFRVVVHAPKYRRKPEPIKTSCAECGLTYYRGDPESTASHRREHKKRARFFDPTPSSKLLAARLADPRAGMVRSASPAWMHAEMYGRALAFKREFGYDFIQWGSEKTNGDPFMEGHLLSNEAGTIVGACAFRRQGEGDESYLALQWIWLAPMHRRAGHLSRYWQAFRERYGAFHVEGPVSDAMQAFLARRDESWLMDETAIPRGTQ